ncbi:hypothetical protein EVAR_34674_1 [Eumeta japonica]|uniref:Uncharacterized protein n=1 Tax=Eumeta variegata TaxID=151549 RepID=A0A4C1VH73_EUMVA|nr:hypothetical protein EVAR_34674_1 [Eumeta japonica]
MEEIIEALRNIQKELDEQKIAIQQNGEKIQVENQEKRLYFLEKQARQRNIVFFGIEETETSYKNVEINMTKFIKTYFGLHLDPRDLQEIKRIGKKGERPRPITVTFSTLGTKIDILKKKGALKDTEYYVKEDYPQYILQKRKELREQLKIEKEKGNNAVIKKGSKTRRPTLPILFIAILENIIGKLDWRKLGLCIKGAYLNHLRFADDLVLLSETASEMQLMIETLHNSSNKVGLEMNLTKLSGRVTSRLTDQRWTSRVTRWTGPPGKRRPGRPPSRWEDDIKRTAGTNWRLVAQDRDKWKSLEEACTQKGITECLANSIEPQCFHAPPPHDIAHIQYINEEVQNKAFLEPKDDLPPVSISEVQTLVKSLKTKKALGLDRINTSALTRLDDVSEQEFLKAPPSLPYYTPRTLTIFRVDHQASNMRYSWTIPRFTFVLDSKNLHSSDSRRSLIS